MGKTRDLFNKIRDTREYFMQRQAQLRTETMDLTEAEYIKKRSQGYTEELYQKIS